MRPLHHLPESGLDKGLVVFSFELYLDSVLLRENQQAWHLSGLSGGIHEKNTKGLERSGRPGILKIVLEATKHSAAVLTSCQNLQSFH